MVYYWDVGLARRGVLGEKFNVFLVGAPIIINDKIFSGGISGEQ